MWMVKCQGAFNTLKALCTSAPILVFADFTKPFKLHTDASTTGLDAVLYQEQDWNKQVKGMLVKLLPWVNLITQPKG